MFAQWSGKEVRIYMSDRTLVRILRVRDAVVGVQISGESRTDATVAIAMANGHTDLYRSDGTILRHG